MSPGCRCARFARGWRAPSPARSSTCWRTGTRRRPASDIFVLTRTWVEAKAVAARARARGVSPPCIYNQEGLYASPEARQVRDLLRAVADPRDPAKRLRAWLTPFFGLSLADLPAAAGAEGDHPLFARLFAWHAAAAREPLGRLYARILDESGVISARAVPR